MMNFILMWNYDNTRTALDDCIRSILRKQPLEWMHLYGDGNIRLNEHFPLGRDELKNLINGFKNSYNKIKLLHADKTDVESTDKTCIVKGIYKAKAKFESHILKMEGKWVVELELNTEFGYWYIINVQIEGIDFKNQA